MKVLKDLMALLNIDLETAKLVDDQMARNGVDFSGCSTRTFNKEAKAAYGEIKG